MIGKIKYLWKVRWKFKFEDKMVWKRMVLVINKRLFYGFGLLIDCNNSFIISKWLMVNLVYIRVMGRWFIICYYFYVEIFWIRREIWWMILLYLINRIMYFINEIIWEKERFKLMFVFLLSLDLL